MKATGIVRRIDDLGRVVIPKELRSIHGLEERTPMEIFTEGDSIIFRAYNINKESEVSRKLKGLVELSEDSDYRAALTRAIEVIEKGASDE
ncbi:AbrB/MazE/SpoVT family DNA-binding domain-containing protein [Rossellomorea marisflavi]|uniref:AbrB/MazE/SpoVT family DNA-binding domain-containing protein n=1 Tax=Rossellomorea marisflavi TaxID=189381 RepID=UPI00345E0478